MPSVGVWQDSPPHGSGTGNRAALGGSLLRRQQGRREPPQPVPPGPGSGPPATVPLPDHRYLIIIGWHWDFLKLIPWEYVRVGAGVLPLETSLHNGTARPRLMPCMDGRLFYADRHSRQPDQFMDGLSVPGKRVDQQGFLPSIDLSDKNA